jgi:hypothetical protein
VENYETSILGGLKWLNVIRFRTKIDGQGTLQYGLCALFNTVPGPVVG